MNILEKIGFTLFIAGIAFLMTNSILIHVAPSGTLGLPDDILVPLGMMLIGWLTFIVSGNSDS